MVTETEQGKADLAQDALEAIREMELAALRRAMPPLWFGVAISILCGALVAVSAAALREFQPYLLVCIALVLVYQAQKSGVSMGQHLVTSRWRYFAGLVGIALMFFLVVIASQLLILSTGLELMALLGGVAFGGLVYVISARERRWYQGQINSGQAGE